MKIANNVCKEQQITRISEGKYCIGGKNVFVRVSMKKEKKKSEINYLLELNWNTSAAWIYFFYR